MTGIEQLQQMIDQTDNIVFFGGAGVSTESGIPDFRSVDGLYHQKYDYPPETILSHTFFVRQTREFYRFYRDKMLVLDAEPNAAHRKLAELEACGKLKAVVTQNIDGLHQRAGSQKVLELHGSIHRNYCQRCHKKYSGEALKKLFDEGQDVPCCTCGGVIKPDVVLYEEGLDSRTMQESISYISEADVLIIGGTSLAVYPAAGLIDYFNGSHLVVINMAPTPRDRQADLLIQEKIGTVLGALHV
ncbi:MAG: NAD-dependent protein deacylase [Clostridiales bacterium]|nr:NAD-dependent protein deacylase [Clostridiales bacterium]